MKFDPYPCQQAAIDHAAEFLMSSPAGAKQLYKGPTGVGKSIIELMLQERLGRADAMIVTPRVEIIDGMLDKLEAPLDACGEDYNIWTPITLRNRLMSPDRQPRRPKYVIFDETHHHEANSWQQLDLLTGLVPSVGFTATPFRGTPKSTRSFREVWGEPLDIITYEEAIACGYIKMPHMSILPLVDDDEIDIVGGEFSVTSLEAATVDRLGDLANHSAQWYKNGLWDKATIYALPSTKTCEMFQHELAKRGMPAAIVASTYNRGNRPEVFRAVEQRVLALLHVNVVQEGVDLRLERLVDAAAMMSPVKWAQQFGRIMRRTVAEPEYICTNRNILRHAYILEGIVPSSVVGECDAVFPPAKRGHTRVLGLEAIGRFKPTSCELLSGGKLYVYAMTALIEKKVFEFACLVPPNKEAIWAVKVNTSENGVKAYGNWQRCDQPTDLKGFCSQSTKDPSEKQQNWWKRSAAAFGLNPEEKVDRKAFVALPVCVDIGEHL